MTDEAMWTKRVAEWQVSGLPSTQFSEGRGFSASALRYWRKRLERTASSAPSPVRLARVVRVDDERDAPASVTIEAAGLRILVPPHADRDSLRLVLDVLREVAQDAR